MDKVYIGLTILGWIVLGILIPVVKHVFGNIESRLKVIENCISEIKKEGYMTIEQHEEHCDKIRRETNESFCRKLDELFRLHKEWLEERLGRMESEMKLYVKSQKNDNKITK